MAGKGNKKNQDNFEKLKREMTIKKQKAKIKRNSDISQLDAESVYLKEMPRANCLMQKNNKCSEAVTEDINKGKSDSITEKVPEENIVKKVQMDKRENRIDINKIELVVFQVEEEEFALKVSDINEIIRVPSMTKVPGAPQHIIGLCGLRGALLPVINSRAFFSMPDKEYDENSRIIVTDIYGKKVGLVSDKVLEVISVEESTMKEPPGSIKGIDGGVLNGILVLNDGKRMVMMLDAQKLIRAGNLEEYSKQQEEMGKSIKNLNIKDLEEEQIIIFNIGIGEYAFNIKYVKEIIRLPAIMKVPNTASYVEGVFSIRNQLLAVINLGRLLSISYEQPHEYSRVVIINNGELTFGVIVDRVSHVIKAQKKLFKESIQIANCHSIEYVKGIFNLNDGKRQVLLLEPMNLITSVEVKGILGVDQKKMVNNKALGEADNKLEHIVAFKLGEEEYGIEINNVQEINRISGIMHFPGTPSFIDGMVNLRDDIIPILNLRKLFIKQDSDFCNSSEFLVVEFRNKKIGIMIDSVSEVLRFSKIFLEEAPEVFKENYQDHCVEKIAKLNDGKRIVLILNLTTLLSFM